jgi:hypothetical protein
VLQPLTEALKKPYEAPYHGKKRQMKLRKAAPTMAQSLVENFLASKFAIRLHPLLALHGVQHRGSRG